MNLFYLFCAGTAEIQSAYKPQHFDKINTAKIDILNPYDLT